MNTYDVEFSEKEQKMFISLGFGHLLDHINWSINLYRIAVWDSFIHNKTGNDVDSLRRACIAIDNCTPYRMTKEFDDLIIL
jgi:hypothetical protein